ncbi:MAG: GDP-mannose 4,6-dehydratase [Magnetococcales bacterium]|nr:GDP-mannose 4,6-dehydratase [Magnetococcales bacterium]
MKRVLVTGGAGFIGSHLVEWLIGQGARVTVLDDFSTGERANLIQAAESGDLRVIEGSILNPEQIELSMRECDRVYHLAVQCVRRSLGQPLQNHAVNATGTLNLLEAARRHKIRRFVYCSSSEVYGNSGAGPLHEESPLCPVTVYGAAKLAGEYYTLAYWRTYGLPVAIVRPFNAYGPREHDQGDLAEVIPRFVIRVLNGLAPVIFGDGLQGRDFTHVTEIARGIGLAGNAETLVGRIVNLAYGRMITIREVAETITRLAERPELTPVFTTPRPGDVGLLHAATQRASELLDYRAAIPFETGLQDYLDWFVRTHPDPSLLLEPVVINWEMPT